MGKGNIEIIVGTTEEYILGYELNTGKDGLIQLRQTFADHSHMGSVRQVAVSGNFLVSGAADEVLRIFNLKSRTEVGTIMEHNGTITHVSFHGTKYLFSASMDGKICIFNRGKWQCDKTLKGHRGGVTGLSVHPSGKLALSVGRDGTLRTWNLIKGRKAYITNLKTAADSVQWSPTGSHYLLVRGSCVEVYLVASAKLVHTVDFKQTVSSLAFITDELVAVGGEGQNICLYDIGGTEMLQWEAHKMRVKCLRVLPEAASAPGHICLASASSDGTIKVWGLDLLLLSSPPKLLGEVNTTCRIICMDAYLPPVASASATPTPIVSTEEVPSSEEEMIEDEEGDDDEEVEQGDEGVEDENLKGGDSDKVEEDDLDEDVEEEEQVIKLNDPGRKKLQKTNESKEVEEQPSIKENGSGQKVETNSKRKKKNKRKSNGIGHTRSEVNPKKKKLM